MHYTRLRIILLVLITGITLMVYCIALAALPHSPISFGRISRINTISLVPEGWAFFTRDAREDMIIVYKKNSAGIWEQVNVPGASARYLFGLDRKGRAIGVELAMLQAAITDSIWQASREPLTAHFQHDTLPVQLLKNNAAQPLCLGDIIVQVTPPVPWAWARNNKKVIMPYKIARLYVETDH
ncbi:SdpA family antimicrobial peptide system protein [Chitinophaga pendula]|uniref:SdpA family antimicrobial peptide system protein n=1 Tax=Chitinophaga TaxID=79328 RepID=UPI000BAFCCE3|nr:MULTISPECIES: SdpA family antimicrobial peptide system protein [Chitinophaga]ASZ11346.1 hypothetical protein CK934_10390 [Chitinophaga sp. MD30]UCJ05652.1 SdpA family antimicrobial peptide system protein [Chitinophaga pendula]